MTNDRYRSRRRLDVASLLLTVVGVSSAALSLWLIDTASVGVAVIIPSIVAATVGVTHITKREVTRR